MTLRSDDMADETDRLLLEGQRAAARDAWAQCLAAADEALKRDPNRADGLFLAAAAMRKAGNEGVALQLLNVASKIEPNRAAVWLQMSMCLVERHPEQAYKAALKAQAIRPDMLDTLSVLTNVTSQMGRHAEALEWADRAERLYGVHPEVMHNKSFALFALGRWKDAWRSFKPSLGMPARKIRNYHADKDTPRWNPDKHENATVVIYGEQGIGDEIMYASMIDRAIEAAEAKGSRVIVECDRRNAGLFRRSFDAPVFGTRSEMYCEWPADEGVTHKIEMGGLGEFFAPIPFRRGGYLSADAARVQAHAGWLKWTNRPAGGTQPRVGIAWTGGSWETGRDRRSIPAEAFLQLAHRHRDTTFVCLEYEDREADLEGSGILNPHWATRKGADYDDLAALVANLDLVIAVQTSVVDLCGALGVPCWALCDATPQWRYTGHFGDETMFFYEGVRVFRQEEAGDWAPVMRAVSDALAGQMEAAA